jgi:CRP-like cAMP-binding protein
VAIWNRHTDSADNLANLLFFDGFSRDELERVAHLGRLLDFPAGTLVIDQGSVGQECYLIVAGAASVYMGRDFIAGLEAGSMVGEMALVDHRPRRATVVATTPLRVLAFDTRAFRTLLEEMPRASDRIMRLLYARLERNESR